MTRLWLSVLACVGAMLGSCAANAHTRSESHSTWLVDGSAVHLTFSAPDNEVRRLAPAGHVASQAEFLAYLGPRVGAAVAGTACPLAAPARSIPAATGYQRVEFTYNCPSSVGIVLHSAAFYDLVPTHVNIAVVQTAQGVFLEDVLTAERQTVDLTANAGDTLQAASLATFVQMGIMHIFTGVDHMSFLLGLVLISRRFKDLAFVITGFTIGHSLTLALAATGIVRPHAEFIDALVALTIALIGVENIAVHTGRYAVMSIFLLAALSAMAILKLFGIGLLPITLLIGAGLFASNYLMVSGYIRDAARLRLIVTLIFGLIHGFGFAADLLSETIPTEKLAELLVGFNGGVEIGQLTVVGVLTGAVFLLRRFGLALPRPMVVDVCASGLVLIGTYWFISRSYSLA